MGLVDRPAPLGRLEPLGGARITHVRVLCQPEADSTHTSGHARDPAATPNEPPGVDVSNDQDPGSRTQLARVRDGIHVRSINRFLTLVPTLATAFRRQTNAFQPRRQNGAADASGEAVPAAAVTGKPVACIRQSGRTDLGTPLPG